MLRITTRLAHSRADVECKPIRPQNEIKLCENKKQFILLPANARVFYRELLAKQPHL
jgi:indolepyruvate ferredoxin oxidoreductase alpha subunit